MDARDQVPHLNGSSIPCPFCNRPMRKCALYCFDCFCVLPMALRYSLASRSALDRQAALAEALFILRDNQEEEARRPKTGELFHASEKK